MVTELQAKMIVAIAEDELTPCNGGRPDKAEDASTWADMVITDAETRGVARSLVNAGLIYHDHEGRDAIVGLTNEGFAEYNRIKDSK